MKDMEFRDDELILDKSPNALDELVIDVTGILEHVGIKYAVISGYIAVLLGRARATEDIDVVTERFSETVADQLATELQAADYWGPAMPLEGMYDTLNEDLPIRIADDGHRVPNVELKFAVDEYDRASLTNTRTVRLGDDTFTIGSLELQIAYKLNMGAEKDFEDALYLYQVLEPTLNNNTLEEWVERLGVEDEYDQLRRT